MRKKGKILFFLLVLVSIVGLLGVFSLEQVSGNSHGDDLRGLYFKMCADSSCDDSRAVFEVGERFYLRAYSYGDAELFLVIAAPSGEAEQLNFNSNGVANLKLRESGLYRGKVEARVDGISKFSKGFEFSVVDEIPEIEDFSKERREREESENIEEVCDDGIDNDFDGKVDEDDSECFSNGDDEEKDEQEERICGDGKVDERLFGGEECDDGNLIDGDGCSLECDVEENYVCEGEPSECVLEEEVIEDEEGIVECGEYSWEIPVNVEASSYLFEELDVSLSPDETEQTGYGESGYGDLEDMPMMVCAPGEQETRSYGESDVGICEFGIEERVCNGEGQWGEWSVLQEEVLSDLEETCDDGLDNNCNGEVDEGCVFVEQEPVDEGSVEICDDGIDNDGDELIDGEDGDCEIVDEEETQENVCGDGIVLNDLDSDGNLMEQCDDSNLDNGDGCNSECKIELGHVCSGEPSVCVLEDEVGVEEQAEIKYNFKPENTVDENFDSIWISQFSDEPQNLILDFGGVRCVDSLEIYTTSAFAFENEDKKEKVKSKIDIESSVDGENWEEVEKGWNPIIIGSEIGPFERSFDETQARYLKVSFNTQSISNGKERYSGNAYEVRANTAEYSGVLLSPMERFNLGDNGVPIFIIVLITIVALIYFIYKSSELKKHFRSFEDMNKKRDKTEEGPEVKLR